MLNLLETHIILEKLYQLSNLNTLCIFIYSLYSYIELNCLVWIMDHHGLRKHCAAFSVYKWLAKYLFIENDFIIFFRFKWLLTGYNNRVLSHCLCIVPFTVYSALRNAFHVCYFLYFYSKLYAELFDGLSQRVDWRYINTRIHSFIHSFIR